MSEQITIVSSKDVELQTEDKFQAHKYPVQRHRAVSVWAVSDTHKVLLQQRSAQKIVGAGWWANTVCGNVWAGETYAACALRRLQGELGIVVTQDALQLGKKFEYRAYCNSLYGEHEIDQIFLLKKPSLYRQELEINTNEVSETLWVDSEELTTKVVRQISEVGYYSAHQTLIVSWNELAQNMRPLEISVHGKKIALAPWTVFMLAENMVAFS